MESRKPYPSDVSDEEWAFAAPYLALLREDATQRKHSLREVFNGLRYIVKTGGQWRWMPHDLPPWPIVYQQARRWLDAGVFEAMLHDLRALLRLAQGRLAQPTSAIFDSQTLQSTPESGAHGGYDGAKRKRGSKVHAAVDTLGHLLALVATPADAQDRAQVAALATAVQVATGDSVELAVGTGQAPALGARGEADVVLVHAPESERTWMAEGNGAFRLLVMHNDFVLTGPGNDPAGVKGRSDAQAAFAQIARAGATFVSRGDNSGTHQAELAIWRAAGVEPRGKSWYQESGQGMGATLNITDEKRAYTLTDRSTFLARRGTLQLRVLVEGSAELLNVYHVMPVNPAKFPGVNAPGGQAFASFMTSRETQTLIAAYGQDRYGQPLFFADAGKPDN